jgi:hypothetical protein
MNVKRSVVVVAVVLVLSVLISGVALAGGWNKWQPINHSVIDGEFKFSGNALWRVKEYTVPGDPGFVGDLVGYLAPYDGFAEFDSEVYYAECVPQGATIRTTFGKGWIEELTGRDLSFVQSDVIYTCIYPAGWHDAQP